MQDFIAIVCQLVVPNLRLVEKVGAYKQSVVIESIGIMMAYVLVLASRNLLGVKYGLSVSLDICLKPR